VPTSYNAWQGPKLTGYTRGFAAPGAKAPLDQVSHLTGNPETLVPAPTKLEQKQAAGSKLGKLSFWR
jgi:hypothetical protein